MKNELIEFLKSDKAQCQLTYNKYGRKDTLSIIKFCYDENNMFLYTLFNYENDLNLSQKFEYAGFYNLKSNKLYDLDYHLRDILKIDYNDCAYLDTLKKNITSLILEKADQLINNDIKSIDAKKAKSKMTESDYKEIKEHTEYYAKKEAEEYFIKNKTVENIRIHIPYFKNISIADVIGYLNNDKEIFILEKAANHIGDNLKNIYMSFLKMDICKKEFLKIHNDKTNILHLKRSISNSITDQKTVNVTIFKDGKEFTFKTETSSLTSGVYCNYYSTYHIQASDRQKFEELFGRSADYTANEITKIVYCKKPLYMKESEQCA